MTGLHELELIQKAIAKELSGVIVEFKPWENEMIVFKDGKRVCSGNLDFNDISLDLDLILVNTKALLETGGPHELAH